MRPSTPRSSRRAIAPGSSTVQTWTCRPARWAARTTAASALITDRSRQVNYGAAHGVFGTVYDVGDALGPIAAGVLVSTIGYTGMFEVAAMVALGGAMSQLRSRSTDRAGAVTS